MGGSRKDMTVPIATQLWTYNPWNAASVARIDFCTFWGLSNQLRGNLHALGNQTYNASESSEEYCKGEATNTGFYPMVINQSNNIAVWDTAQRKHKATRFALELQRRP